MVFYISSHTYHPMISKVLSETNQVCVGSEVGEEIYFKKYIRENIGNFGKIDTLILDLLALADTDEEITAAIESLMVMDYRMKIIIIASRRKEGDKLLRDCFLMGIYNLITTDEYLQLHQDITQCIETGMKYKDAMRFREAQESQKQEETKAIQKILIGMAGIGHRAGCTHNSIVFANFLRKLNYMTAIVEMNSSGAFTKICEVRKENFFSEGYFSITGVDFYPNGSQDKLIAVSGRLYNFILLDFGDIFQADKVLFNKCDIRIIISGSRPWEIEQLNQLFEEQEEDVLEKYHYCFLNAASNKTLQKEIMESMGPLNNIYFPEYAEDPFTSSSFPEGPAILSGYHPIVKEEKKQKKTQQLSGLLGNISFRKK